MFLEYIDHVHLVWRYIIELEHGNFTVILIAINNSMLRRDMKVTM